MKEQINNSNASRFWFFKFEGEEPWWHSADKEKRGEDWRWKGSVEVGWLARFSSL